MLAIGNAGSPELHLRGPPLLKDHPCRQRVGYTEHIRCLAELSLT